jgi:hypothetical protein
MSEFSFPACFDSFEQFELWMEAAKFDRPGKSGYCEDCTPEYQREMIEQQRCAFRGTKFFNIDGIIVGVRDGMKKPNRKRKIKA